MGKYPFINGEIVFAQGEQVINIIESLKPDELGLNSAISHTSNKGEKDKM